jgi:hypothetical protein
MGRRITPLPPRKPKPGEVLRRPGAELDALDMCECGHDYGTHDSSKGAAPCSGTHLRVGAGGRPHADRCKCVRFLRASNAQLVAKAQAEAIQREADKRAGDDFIRSRAASLSNAHGDDLSLFRIAKALERIVELLEAAAERDAAFLARKDGAS